MSELGLENLVKGMYFKRKWLVIFSHLTQLGSFEVISGQNISDPLNHMVEIFNLKLAHLG